MSKGVARTYATALCLYDVTGGLRIGKRHRRITGRRRWPISLRCAPTGWWPRPYYDARADDARLTLAVARTAAVDYGAVMANTPRWLAPHDPRGPSGARVRPAAPGAGRSGDGEFEVGRRSS